MFNIDEFIIAVYLCVDAHLESLLTLYPPRSRGFAPGFSDSEFLTLEQEHVLSLIPEFIRPQDGAEKQDSETAADPTGKYTTQGNLLGHDTPTQGELF